MALLLALVLAEVTWLAAAGFPEVTRVLALPGSWEWDINLGFSPAGSVLTIGLVIAVWREVRPAYYVALLLEALMTAMLALAQLSGDVGPFSVALALTVARLAILLSPPIRRTLMRGLSLRTAIARM
jgi:hypothetical protein